MIRNLILIGLIYLLYRTVKSWAVQKQAREHSSEPIEDVMMQDPVCGMYVPRRDAVTLKHGGQTHFFCSDKCKDSYLLSQKK